MMRVCFRVDASAAIGSGHLHRCLTLADALHAAGASTAFICRELPGHLLSLVESRGHALHVLPRPVDDEPVAGPYPHSPWLGVGEMLDARQSAAMLGEIGSADWLVVDHYAIGASWHRALRAQTRKILVIDDLADRPHDADLLLDQNLAVGGETRYDGLLPADCGRMLGPHYALLRPEFEQARTSLEPRRKLERALVFLGGVDAGNVTGLGIEALLDVAPPLSADVVVGGGNPHAAAIAAVCGAHPHLRFHQAVNNMAELMVRADLAIGAGGSTTWERACLGLPAIILVLADNQRPSAQAMAAADCALALEADKASSAEVATLIEALGRQPERLTEMSRRNLVLVDGRGVHRVVRAMLAPTVTLRRATVDDSASLWEWRNHEDTRRHAHDSAPIARVDHERWLAAVLKDDLRDLLIAEHCGRAVGVLRYDCPGEEALVSIYLVPRQPASGFGPVILREGHRWLARMRPGVLRVRAEIHQDNHASRRAFAEAGYVCRGDSWYHMSGMTAPSKMASQSS